MRIACGKEDGLPVARFACGKRNTGTRMTRIICYLNELSKEGFAQINF
jgi:hypothetical protein